MTAKHVLPQHLHLLGLETVQIACARCPGRRIGLVLVDRSSRHWLAVTNPTWRKVVNAGLQGRARTSDAWLVNEVNEVESARVRCRKHGWLTVDVDRLVKAVGAGRPTHPARLLV